MIKNITSSIYTVEYNDDLLNCNCIANSINVYLSSARNYTQNVTIKKVDSTVNTLTIHPANGETIEENSTIILTEINEYKTLSPTSNGWIIVSTSIDMSSISDNEIIMKNIGNSLKGSGVTQIGDELESELSLMLPPNSLHLGDNISLHENGGAIEYHTETSNKDYVLICNENSDSGTTVPFYFKHDALDTRTILQADDSQTMEDVTSLTFTPIANHEVTRVYSKFVNAVTNFKVKIEINGSDVAYYPSKNAWNDDTVDGFDLDAGESYIDLDPHFSFLTTYNMVAYYKADQQIDMLGDGTTHWLAVDKKDLTKQDMALDVVETTTFLNNASQSIIIGTDDIRSASILYYCNDTTTYEGGVIILVSDGSTSEIDSERIGESDIPIADIEFSTSIVDSNLCLNITATGDGLKTITFQYKLNIID